LAKYGYYGKYPYPKGFGYYGYGYPYAGGYGKSFKQAIELLKKLLRGEKGALKKELQKILDLLVPKQYGCHWEYNGKSYQWLKKNRKKIKKWSKNKIIKEMRNAFFLAI